MNICETKMLLSILWSMYPNAPKFNNDAVEMMALSWATVLGEFSKEDALKAMHKAASESPKFVPTAMEVRQYCQKSIRCKFTQDEIDTAIGALRMHCLPVGLVPVFQEIADAYEDALREYDEAQALGWEPKLKKIKK